MNNSMESSERAYLAGRRDYYSSRTKTLLAVCVATCRRPEMLKDLLRGLSRLQRPEDVEVEIRIVDNDPLCSGSEVVSEFCLTHEMPFTVRFAVLSERNIALARNRALDMGEATYVAFIDDDEIPGEGWLSALMDALQSFGVDAVFGGVHAELPPQAVGWIVRNNIYEKRVGDRFRSLTWRSARTSNALVDGRWFFENGLRFSREFGRTGAEDSDLFFRMSQRGAVFATAPGAEVTEMVPPRRAGFGAVMARNLRGGGNFFRLAVRTRQRPLLVLTLAGKLLARAFQAVLFLPLLLVGQPDRTLNAVAGICRAVGGLRSALWFSGPSRAAAYNA